MALDFCVASYRKIKTGVLMSRDTVHSVTEMSLRAAILDTDMCMRGARIHPFHCFWQVYGNQSCLSDTPVASAKGAIGSVRACLPVHSFSRDTRAHANKQISLS